MARSSQPRWYNTLSTYLVKLGFKANPRDECVFNMPYEGQQLILLHVDDLMILCEYQSGIDYVITSLNKEYSRANVYDKLTLDYLGMLFNFSVPGEVSIGMGKMVQEFLDEVAVAVDARAETPAAHYLYNVDNENQSLSNNEKDNLHSLVAKALYMAKRGRPDLLTAVSFLTTQVNCPNQGDYKKLKRLSSYLNATKDLNLISKANLLYSDTGFSD